MWLRERSAVAWLTPGVTAINTAMGPATGMPCWLRSVAEKSDVAITAPVPIASAGSPDPPMVGSVAVPTTRRGS